MAGDVDGEPRARGAWRHAPSAAPGAARLRLMCVEDNEVNAMLLREIIALRPAIELRLVGDAAQALAQAGGFAPGVFLLDMHLPDLDGTSLMRALRRDPCHAGARYIALSANAMPDHIRGALDAGFDDYWTKPIDVPALLAALDALAAASPC